MDMDARDLDELRRINLEIGDIENTAGREYFNSLLAPAFAFRRASGVVVDRLGYLNALEAGGARQTKPESIQITPAGKNAALVTCTVSMPVKGQPKNFHNARLFVRGDRGGWQLLAWANEEL